jgi:ribosomal protein S17E
LKDSPYGEQYYIPDSELNQAVKEKDIVDVKEVSKRIDKEQFINELTEATQAALSKNIKQTEDNIKEDIKRQNGRLQKDIQALKDELQQLREQQSKSLWNRIKSFFT